MDKETAVHIHNGILFGLEKGNPGHTTIWMNLEDIILSEISHISTGSTMGARR